MLSMKGEVLPMMRLLLRLVQFSRLNLIEFFEVITFFAIHFVDHYDDNKSSDKFCLLKW